MIEVSVEGLYDDACRTVGHLTVVNARLQAEVERLAAEVAALREAASEPPA